VSDYIKKYYTAVNSQSPTLVLFIKNFVYQNPYTLHPRSNYILFLQVPLSY